MSLVNPSYIPSVSPVHPLYNGDRWGLGGDWGLGLGGDWWGLPLGDHSPSKSPLCPLDIPCKSHLYPRSGPSRVGTGWGLGGDWVGTGEGLGRDCSPSPVPRGTGEGLVGTPLGDRKMDFEVEIITHSEGGTGRDQDRPVCPYIIYIGEGRDGSPHLLGLWCQLGGGLPQQHCTGCPCAKRGRACRPTPACLRLGGTISSSPRHQPSNPTRAYFPSRLRHYVTPSSAHDFSRQRDQLSCIDAA